MKRHSYRHTSEDELIQAAKNSDQAAFTELVRRYEETVYRFSYKICRDKTRAEETLQDTFINVFRKLRSFDGKSKFSTWLYTIVTNNCLMKLRRRKMADLEDSLEEYDHPPAGNGGKPGNVMARWEETPADIVIAGELKELLERAIRSLAEDYLVVFVMRDIEGRSTEETASILGLSIEATKSRLRRARAFLREQLHPHMSAHTEGLP
jgi:RNA polymerase sigma-70 factor (ECF subfamily)